MKSEVFYFRILKNFKFQYNLLIEFSLFKIKKFLGGKKQFVGIIEDIQVEIDCNGLVVVNIVMVKFDIRYYLYLERFVIY